MLLESEVYVYVENSEVYGFIGVNDEHIEGIFITNEVQSRGIGKSLLDFVKEKKLKTKHIIIVTGLSGAGKTTALNILEDMNYYTIDNLPLGLEKSLLDTEIEKLAVGIDIRTFKNTNDFFKFIKFRALARPRSLETEAPERCQTR